MADEKSNAKKPKIQLPPEFEGDEAAFLQDMRKKFAADEAFDRENREAGIEDLQFLVGDQWDARVRARRIAKRRPVLTINRLPAFVGQVLGARLENETAIKVLPDTGGDKEVARVRQGLIRSIQKNSRADQAFDNALAGCVCAGIGNFQLDIDYENEETWHQSISIRPIPDHFSVVWDRCLTDPTGADAAHCFIVETMPLDTYRCEYPWATPTDIMADRLSPEVLSQGWFHRDDVRIVTYWQVRERKRTIALMRDGATIDITDKEPDDPILAQIATDRNGDPMIRDVYRKYARMYRCSGTDVLEGPYDLPINRVPVFRVPGWEIRIGGRVHRWGLIRHMKDPQKLHNYWRSAIAEKIMQSPKQTWIAGKTAIQGYESKWRNANESDDPLLIWNDESGNKPERVEPIQIEQALILQAEMTEQDLKDVSNIHEANLGMPSNEVSGRGIQARQRISRLGTEIFNANLTKAIEECGRVINDLIPIVYDTPRVIRILGDDAQPIMQAINDTTDENAIDITVGKYSITVSTGPSYETKQVEQAENMVALATAMPNVMGMVADYIVEAQDWPKADRIAERIRMSMPPHLLSPDEMTPAIQAQAAQQAEAQRQQIETTVRQVLAELLETQSKAMLNMARARQIEAQTGVDAATAPAEVDETQARTVKTLAEARRIEKETELLPLQKVQPEKQQANVIL